MIKLTNILYESKILTERGIQIPEDALRVGKEFIWEELVYHSYALSMFKELSIPREYYTHKDIIDGLHKSYQELMKLHSTDNKNNRRLDAERKHWFSSEIGLKETQKPKLGAAYQRIYIRKNSLPKNYQHLFTEDIIPVMVLLEDADSFARDIVNYSNKNKLELSAGGGYYSQHKKEICMRYDDAEYDDKLSVFVDNIREVEHELKTIWEKLCTILEHEMGHALQYASKQSDKVKFGRLGTDDPQHKRPHHLRDIEYKPIIASIVNKIINNFDGWGGGEKIQALQDWVLNQRFAWQVNKWKTEKPSLYKRAIKDIYQELSIRGWITRDITKPMSDIDYEYLPTKDKKTYILNKHELSYEKLRMTPIELWNTYAMVGIGKNLDKYDIKKLTPEAQARLKRNRDKAGYHPID